MASPLTKAAQVPLPVIRGVTGQGPVEHKGGRTTSIQVDGIDHVLSQQELCHLP